MFGIGGGELLVIALAALLIFGPSRIPELARNLGRFYREITRVRRQVDDTLSELRSEIDFSGDLDPAPSLRPPAGERRFRGQPAPARIKLPVPDTDDYLQSDVPPPEQPPAGPAQPSDPGDYLAGGGQ